MAVVGPLDPLTAECQRTLAYLERMPADLKRRMSRHVMIAVAQPLAAGVRQAARGAGPYGRHIQVRAVAGLEPAIIVGGQSRAVRNGATGAQLFYGTEFGGSQRKSLKNHRPYARRAIAGQTANRLGLTSVWRNTTKQFVPAHPFVYPTFRRTYEPISEAWLGVLDPFLAAWTNEQVAVNG